MKSPLRIHFQYTAKRRCSDRTEIPEASEFPPNGKGNGHKSQAFPSSDVGTHYPDAASNLQWESIKVIVGFHTTDSEEFDEIRSFTVREKPRCNNQLPKGGEINSRIT
jgi:hypothetical protein